MTERRMVRVALITDRRAMERDGRIFAEPAIGRLVEQLARRFGSVDLVASPSEDHTSLMTQDVTAIVRRFEPLPVMRSFAHGVRFSRRVAAIVRDVETENDVSLVQLPFPAPLALIGRRGPRVYNVCADVLDAAIAAPQYHGLRRAAAIMVGFGIHRIHVALTRRRPSRTVTNGDALLAKLRPRTGVATVSSVIRYDEVGSFDAVPRGRDLRVLFVGYLHPYKGVDLLLRAFEELRRRGIAANLTLVGALPLLDRGVAASIERVASAPDSHVVIAGQVPFGPSLFRHYATSHVLVLPSLTEGTPRVLVEARAFGCTVVAARVGGVPSSVSHEVDGLLVPPSDWVAIADALEKLGRDDVLLASLREAGIARARSLTVERFASVLGDEVSAAADEARSP